MSNRCNNQDHLYISVAHHATQGQCCTAATCSCLLDLPECWHKVSCSVFGSALHKSLAPSLHHSPTDTQLKYTRMCSSIHSCHGVTNYFLRQTLFKTAAHCSQRISEAISQTLTHSVILIHRPNLFPPSMHSSTKRSPQQLQYRLYVCVYIYIEGIYEYK